MIRHRIFTLLCILLGMASLAGAADAKAEPKKFSGMSFLDNGKIRLGVNLDIGGAITRQCH